jgi:hypothetical protein
VLERADRAMVGWQEWHYCGCADPTTSGPGDKQAIVRDPSKPPAGDNLVKGTLDTIARPYPQVVAGTPESWSFEPDKHVFDFAYSTKRADGSGSFPAGSETEVAAPPRQYGGGYAVAVQGGTVASKPGAAVLRVAACTGVDRVSLSVKPGNGVTSSCAAATKGAAKAPLRVTLTPRKVRPGKHVTLRATVRANGQSVRGAVVRIGRKRARTDAHGRARLKMRFTHSALRKVVAKAAGYKSGRATVRVRR